MMQLILILEIVEWRLLGIKGKFGKEFGSKMSKITNIQLKILALGKGYKHTIIIWLSIIFIHIFKYTYI